MLPNWKPLPHAVDKLAAKREAARADSRMKVQVRQRDGYHCRVCGRHSRTVHEHPPRSLGTAVSLEHSFVACDVPEGGLCHPLLQRHLIVPVMVSGGQFDASGELAFEMTEQTAAIAFVTRVRPSRIRIVDT
jgi:hypothetical protein